MCIYVEGGSIGSVKGEAGSSVETEDFRRGFRNLIGAEIYDRLGVKAKPCGSRGKAVEGFKNALLRGGELAILLIDSEDAVSEGMTCKDYLRREKGLALPESAKNEDLHLIVQCMETWFLADVEALAGYYKQGFNRNALPKSKELEQVAKPDVLAALKAATRQTQKGRYQKWHGLELLGLLDRKKLVGRCPHFASLLTRIGELEAASGCQTAP